MKKLAALMSLFLAMTVLSQGIAMAGASTGKKGETKKNFEPKNKKHAK